MVNYSKVDSILKDITVNKSELASTNSDLVTEISDCASEIEEWYKQSTIEETIKSIFWHGTLKDYGTFGVKTLETRKFYNRRTRTYFDFNQTISRWRLLSIDFGVTNIGREFSLTHTGIVIADYSGMVVVLPITSQDSVDLSKIPNDIKQSFIPISKVECPDLAKDSYVLIHQIRAVSKNRITKRGIIGKIENTSVQQKIEKSLLKKHSPYMNKVLDDLEKDNTEQKKQIDELLKQNEELLKQNDELFKQNDELLKQNREYDEQIEGLLKQNGEYEKQNEKLLEKFEELKK